jgi:Mg-chelatase subunit ChlD
MAFLAPLFLVGLLAVAVPVLIHLTHRQRREPIAFPSLMFLRRVEIRTTRRQRIRDWLLFALRTLALVLLALAFARPFLRADDTRVAGAANAGREVVILLDHSFSMGYGDRWSRARAAALRSIDGLGAGDRASVVRFATRAEALLQPTSERGALRAAVESTRPGTATGRYAPALSLARGLLGRAERPRREVVLITDLQRTGWVPAEELRLPEGTTLSVVDVGEDSTANLTVTGIELLRTPGDASRAATTARVSNRATRPATQVPVTLTLDGREVARQVVDLPANGAASVRLGPFVVPAATARGVVRVAGGDALAGDDVRHFTLDRGESIGVLVVQDPAAAPSRTLYLRRALAIVGEPGFRVDVHRGDAIGAADLAGHRVVILDDARAPRGESARRLADFVRAGGGLVVTVGERAVGGGDLDALLPAAAGEVVDRMADRGGRLGTLDRSHPVLEPFSAPRSGSFSAPRFFRYRRLATGDSALVIARFDDGGVALAERRVGRGRVLMWGSTFDNVWNDLPLQPVFLPLVRQLVQHAAGWTARRAEHTVGDALDLGALADSARTEYVALSPAGEQARIDAGTPTLELNAPGIWEVRRFGARGTPAMLVPVNVDAAESDLARVPQAEVVAVVAPRSGTTAAGAEVTTLTAVEREARQSLWWYLLLVAAVLLAVETVISNRIRGR